MSTNNTNSSARRMTAAALMVAAAGALGVGAAATANASGGESYAAIAFSPASGTWASFTNASSFIDASAGAVNACHDAGGGLCVLTGSTRVTGGGASCVALAVDPVHWVLWHSGVGPTQISSMTAALDGKDRRIATTTCTTVGGSPNLSFTGKVNQLSGS
ncbi:MULTISPECIES: hypothetical protein [unclassified Mycobacterium]|uniref:hypothetical protein n=1 Tax=unclassified Mycobacterium TaxID=2642494 RepID=UPI0029C6EAB2|nr:MULTISPECIES: hypothetical protein [unclassified Mycobacterium]